MSTAIPISEIIEQALELSGTNTRTKPGRALREVNRATRWAWQQMATGLEGFAILDTLIDSPATGTSLSISAGAGGAGGSDPISTGVFQLRGLYRGDNAGTTEQQLSRAEFMPSTTFYERYGVASASDTRDRVSRPGIYWYRQATDASTDVLELRPRFVGVERLQVIYTPTAPQFGSESDTLEGLNAAETVIAHRAAYRLAFAQDQKLAARLEVVADKLLVQLIARYKGRREVNGPDAVDRYRIQHGRRGRLW